MSQVDGGAPGEGAGGAEQAAPENGAQQQSATADSLLTRPEPEGGEAEKDGESESGKESGKETAKDGESAPGVPETPEGYGLAFAKETQVDEALLTAFRGTAHELGLSTDQAQKLASLYETHVSEAAGKMRESQAKALFEAKRGWEEDIMGRPGFKQEVADARRVLAQYGGEELNELMDQTLLGSHPVFFDFMVRIGKALAEPEARGLAAGKGQAPLDARLWPDMK